MAEYLVHELMRHLVLQHFDDVTPRMVQHQVAGQLDPAWVRNEAADSAAILAQRQRQRFEPIAEVGVVDIGILACEFAKEYREIVLRVPLGHIR